MTNTIFDANHIEWEDTMDNQEEMLLAEIDWLYDEIKGHQEYAKELKDTIEYLRNRIALLEGEMISSDTAHRV